MILAPSHKGKKGQASAIPHVCHPTTFTCPHILARHLPTNSSLKAICVRNKKELQPWYSLSLCKFSSLHKGRENSKNELRFSFDWCGATFVSCIFLLTPQILFLLYFKVNSRHHIILLINNLLSVTNKDFIKYSHNTIITPNKINSNFLISDSIFKKKKFCQSYTYTKERQWSHSLVSDSLWPHCQAPLSCGFSSKNPGVGSISLSRGSSQPRDWTRSPALQADSLPSETPVKPFTYIRDTEKNNRISVYAISF